MTEPLTQKSKYGLIQRAKRRYELDGFTPLVRQTAYRIGTWGKMRLYQKFPSIPQHYIPKMEVGCIEPTNNCNLRCEMCFSQRERKIGYMTWQLWKKVVDEYADFRLNDVLVHYGGESLLHPRFREFLAYIMSKRSEGLLGRVGWVDNAMLFSPEISDYIIELGVDDVCFSVDGIGEVNDRIRKGANYKLIEDNIQYLLEKRGNRKKPMVRINTVEYGKTNAEIEAFIKTWIKRVDEVILSPCLDTNFAMVNAKGYYSTDAYLAKFCYAPFNYNVICWNGDVTTCCADVENRLNLGNVTNQSIKSVWEGQAYRDLRERMLRNQLEGLRPCATCDFWRYEFPQMEQPVFNGEGVLYYMAFKKVFRRKKMGYYGYASAPVGLVEVKQ